ncbi:MAG TPA: flagellar biosynthesis protein FliQ [Gammaproteobacteria bacterium]|nr:flagellar biosynthetic protein FliQ [bacterium BMS3Abin12]HDK03624.1 flagellar biosynthesis protein FliQ [Gammaproteobacteria bacterium]HDO34650.1 flagellar biosynthesis protein FliQ [Chromatiales bacterium]
MNTDAILGVVQQAMQLTILLSAPLLLSALAVGLVVAVFQAATQINELTLTFIPKLIAVVVTLSLAGHWMLGLLVEFTRQMIQNIPRIVGS